MLVGEFKELWGELSTNYFFVTTYANFLARDMKYNEARNYYMYSINCNPQYRVALNNISILDWASSECDLRLRNLMICRDLTDCDPDPSRMGFYNLYLDTGYADVHTDYYAIYYKEGLGIRHPPKNFHNK